MTALAAAGAGIALPKAVRARSRKGPSPDAISLLYDPTRCIGCKECIRACAEANGKDPVASTAPGARLSTRSLTVLEESDVGNVSTFLKRQCMHCVDPACASACMLGAMQKQPDGAVTWNADLCVGCRYCQIACPFNVPRFEWDSPMPELTKCQLCATRREQGQLPACAETCKMGAVVFGLRADMIAEAHRRIEAYPDRYQHSVYGEHDAGGTSVLYMAKAGMSFQDMGLPALSNESVPELPETIQHTLYKGFVAPAALLGVFGTIVRRNTRKLHEAEAAAHEHEHSEPVGGSLFTWPFLILGALALVGLASIAWRFLVGLGPTTNLNDGYPMGLWIAFDVVTGTALACGGYAVAILVYLANRGKYHPLIRAAIVTSALGYTLGGLSVLIDIGRAWNFYKIPLYFTEWNFNSILLEVALCIMLYTMVLWLELSPALLEGWRDSRYPRLRRFAVASLPRINKAMPYVIAVGLLLPTMHQSSLGSLMLLSGAKLHPLWRTPLLPLLFLVSCVGMGYAAVTLEATLSSKIFRRPSELPMLRALALPISLVLLTYVALRAIDILNRGQLPAVLAFDHYSFLFFTEMALFVVPALALLLGRSRASAAFLATIGALVILAGSLYRFSTYLFAFDPGSQWSYFPSLPEFAVTIGLVALELMGYIIIVKRFPILRGAPSRPQATVRAPRLATSSIVPMVVVGLLLAAALLAGVVKLSAQTPPLSKPAAKPVLVQPPPDRRCLTARNCLDAPVPASEPHEGRCATCHNMSKQRTPKQANGSCASLGCHTRADTLTPFHRGLHKQVTANCIGCHPAHNAKVIVGADDCHVCHEGGGQLPSEHVSANVAARTIMPGLVFRHGEHVTLDCKACHDPAAAQHGDRQVNRLAECRSCHHDSEISSNCARCHSTKEVAAIKRKVTRTLTIQVGSLNRPTRTFPFDHALHIDETQCRTCHVPGPNEPAANANCAGCHESHHNATATCTTCHEVPKAGVHDKSAHLDCGGAGCHVNATPAILEVPRTRNLCLACHEERQNHHPGSNCADCHQLPKPHKVSR